MNIHVIAYIASLVIFGFNGIVASFIDLESAHIVLTKTVLGSLLFIAILMLKRQKFSNILNKNGLFVFLSGVMMGLLWIFIFKTYTLLGVGTTSILYSTGPLLVLMLSPIFFNDRLTKKILICFFIVILGVIFVNYDDFSFTNFNIGYLYGAIAAFCYAFMIILNKKAKGLNGITNTNIQLFASAITLIIYCLLFTKISLTYNQSFSSTIAILVLGFINTGFGCYLYFSSIGKLNVQFVAIFDYLEPLSAVVLSTLILGESLSSIKVLGIILVLLGSILASVKLKKFRIKMFNSKKIPSF